MSSTIDNRITDLIEAIKPELGEVCFSGITAYEIFLNREDISQDYFLTVFTNDVSGVRQKIDSLFSGEYASKSPILTIFYINASDFSLKIEIVETVHRITAGDFDPNRIFTKFITDLSAGKLNLELLYVIKSGDELILYDPLNVKDGLDFCKPVGNLPENPEETGDLALRALELSFAYQIPVSDDFRILFQEFEYPKSEKSINRFRDLLFAILASASPSIHLIECLHLKIFHAYFPEMTLMVGIEQKKEYNHKDVFYHTCQVVDNICTMTDDVWLRFAALVHDIAKPRTKRFNEKSGWTFHGHEVLGSRMMKGVFHRLNLPMEKLQYIRLLIKFHLRPIALAKRGVTDSAVRRLITELGDYSIDLITLCRADITSKNLAKVKEYLKNYDIVVERIKEVIEKDRIREFEPPVGGEEIMKVCNLKPSRQVGIIKNEIEEAILSGEIENTYDAAYDLLLKLKEKYNL